MSQGQPRRSQGGGQEQESSQQEGWREQDPIRYGDIFNVTGDLAKKTIAPEDANMMQSAETQAFGKTLRGGPAAVMQTAATYNERAGFVGHRDVSDAAAEQGVTITQTDIPGKRIVTEELGGQVMRQYVESAPTQAEAAATAQSAITIGEALEATARTIGNKPVDQADAAAIRVAEIRAAGSTVMVPGGLASSAQSAADFNASRDRDEDKIKLGDVLSGATRKLPADRVVTVEDAEMIYTAERRNSPNLTAYAGGVAASMAAAARLNDNVNV